MAGDTPPPRSASRSDRAQVAWSILLNSILVAALVLGAIPMVAIVHGFIEMMGQSKIKSGADWIAYGFAFTGLFLSAVFFAYAIKYYLSTAMVLVTTHAGGGSRTANCHGADGPHSNGRKRSGNNGKYNDLGFD